MRNERQCAACKVRSLSGEEYILQKAAEAIRQNPRSGSFDNDFAGFKIVLLMFRSNLPEARAAISAGWKYGRERTEENHEAYGDRFREFVKVMFAPGADPVGDELDQRLLHEVAEWARTGKEGVRDADDGGQS